MSGRAAPPPAAIEPRTAVPAGQRWGDLLPRALSGIVLVVLALGTAVLGGITFTLFWMLAAIAIVWEWQRLVGPDDASGRVLVGGLALLAAGVLTGTGLGGWAVLAVAVGMAAAATWPGAATRGMAACGVLYAGALLLSVVGLRASQSGLGALMWLFAVVWGTDVMAYFGGRLIGGPKLWPRLSPSKTWSGFLVGVTAGGALGVWAAPAGTSVHAVFLVGVMAGVAAQAGDLFESGLKRRYGVKDSSRLIPGHGGVMDRLDGFITACVLAFGIGAAWAGLDAAGVGLFNWPQ